MQTIGHDRLNWQGTDLIVQSPNAYPEFEVRAHRKFQIVFEGRAFFVANKMSLPGGSYHYTLRPWSPDDTEIPGGQIHFTPEFSLHFAKTRRLVKTQKSIGVLLVFLLPMVGFLWSEFKEKLEDRLGWTAYTATDLSFKVEVSAVVLAMALMAILNFTGPAGAALVGIHPGHLFWVLLVLIPDLLYRYDGLNREEKPLYGFYEWLYEILFKTAKKSE
ncbi:MAG: hypothetical protein H6510_15395 [Acidobacteria bacterium]|nr:hypothetical protein [Acidobacteriota bacterium]MCB9399199.1 hypothetical protein [Acidobacteriota bacterium]